jgi:hypothetical protein
MVDEFLPRMQPDEARAFTKRRRGRNIAILIVLVCLCLLFYAIAMVKLAKG